MKKFIGIAVVMLIASQSLVFSRGSKDEGAEIGLVISTLNNPFFVSLKEGAEKRAKKLGINIVVLDSQNDSAKELSNVEDLVTRGVQLLLINPADSDAVGAAVRMANQANIPVITLDRGAGSGTVVSHVASDNTAGGRMAGEYIVKRLNGRGNVVELEGILGTSATRERGRGFTQSINNAKGIKVIAKQTADFDRAKGLNVMENILQKETNIDAVFAHNDEMALGALKAIQGSGRSILVVGFDATDDAVKAVKSGDMAATVAQQPALIGELGVDTAISVLSGKKVKANIPVDLKLIKK